MKTFEKISAFSAALLMTASMGSVYAEAGDVSQESRFHCKFKLGYNPKGLLNS